MSWRRIARAGSAAVAVTLLAACVGAGARQAREEVPRPEWQVGDRWVFQRTLASGALTIVTHEVREATADGYTMRISGLDQEIVRYWTRDLHIWRQTTAGVPTVGFDPAAMYFAWPLRLGREWTQEFEYRSGDSTDRRTNHWRVAREPSTVDVLAGTFRVLKVEHLGAGQERLDAYWYAPRVRYWVRFENYVAGFSEQLLEYRPAAS
jgi:hypothetical protein